MIEVKTAKLEGAALDWAVAIVEGRDVVVHGVGTCRYDKRGGIHCCKYGCTFGPRSITHDVTAYSPSEDWSQGGPLIEKYRIMTRPIDSESWLADLWPRSSGPHFHASQLIAACRAIVAAKLGDVVSVPTELLP